nr:hypothetical protein [uncultured bacterium]
MNEPGGSVRIDGDPDRFQREVHVPPRTNRWIPIVVLLLLLGAGAGGLYWWKQSIVETKPEAATVAPSAAQATKSEPETSTHYPPPAVPPAEQAQAKPLPPLDQSDAAAREALVDLVGSETVARLLSTQDVIRHVVVTVDNLPRKTVAARMNPVKPAGGEFRIAADGDRRTISADNAARYTPYVKLADQVDTKKLVNAYGKLYPLFQKAYEDLGYPNAFFNDRLIAVLDHLIATPDASGPIAVVAPHVQYQYADPDLEAQSAGRKFLMRIGPANAAAIKAKLREIRRELTKAGAGAK